MRRIFFGRSPGKNELHMAHSKGDTQ